MSSIELEEVATEPSINLFISIPGNLTQLSLLFEMLGLMKSINRFNKQKCQRSRGAITS